MFGKKNKKKSQFIAPIIKFDPNDAQSIADAMFKIYIISTTQNPQALIKAQDIFQYLIRQATSDA